LLADERVRWLVATWAFPGAAFLTSNDQTPTPPPEVCCFLLETGAPDEILLEDESGCIALEGC